MCIPDSPRDEAISVTLLQYHKNNYDAQILIDTLDLYVKNLGHKPALLLNFSLEAQDWRNRVIANRRADKQFKETLANTKKLLEGRS